MRYLRYIKFFIAKSFFVIIGFFMQEMIANTVSTGGARVWDIASHSLQVSETIESKVCLLDNIFSYEYLVSFTSIDALQSKVCVVENNVQILESVVDQLSIDIESITSKIDVVDKESNLLYTTISIIHNEDFGGTWTALENIEFSLCQKFESFFDDLATIESKIDQLSIDNTAQFIATFTKLESLTLDVLDTMTLVQSFADQIEYDLANLDSLIDILKTQLTSIDNKVNTLDILIEADFAGTFTSLESIFIKLCNTDTIIDQVKFVLYNDTIDTFTYLESIEKKICSVDSAVDTLNMFLSIIKNKI